MKINDMRQTGSYQSLPWFAIAVETADQYIDTPQPTPKQAAKIWKEDVEKIRSELSRQLAPYEAEKDYYFYGTSESNRLLCLEIANRKLLNDEIVGKVHASISVVEQEYPVDICNYFFLENAAGGRFPDFYIFIERKRIVAWTESPELPAQLGVTPM